MYNQLCIIIIYLYNLGLRPAKCLTPCVNFICNILIRLYTFSGIATTQPNPPSSVPINTNYTILQKIIHYIVP